MGAEEFKRELYSYLIKKAVIFIIIIVGLPVIYFILLFLYSVIYDDDIRHNQEMARQLLSENKLEEALEHYKEAIKLCNQRELTSRRSTVFKCLNSTFPHNELYFEFLKDILTHQFMEKQGNRYPYAIRDLHILSVYMMNINPQETKRLFKKIPKPVFEKDRYARFAWEEVFNEKYQNTRKDE